MAESSYFWTTNGTGDGPVAKYSRADLAQAHKVVGACKGFEGVGPGFLNELVGTVTGANTVSINSGGGLVDGIPYRSTAAVSVTIPSAVGVGNTRIDRIVLRASWAAQTVRITRIAGTDAASPSAPAITQTTETTYDIMLYQALVNTSGTVTLTNERTFASAGSSGIAALAVVEANIGSLAVTNGKIAADAVDYDKAGNRVVKLYGRQGGSASNWLTNGTSNYTPTSVNIQAGSASISTGATGVAITFPTPFSNVPLIFLSLTHEESITLSAYFNSQTASGFTAKLNTAPVDFPAYVNWLAIGPE